MKHQDQANTTASFIRIASSFVLVLAASSAHAELITVDDDGEADFASLQAAVDYASDGDEILVAPGVYTGDRPDRVVDLLGKALTLRSSVGPDVTFINGEGKRRGIDCVSGEGEGTLIKGFTITGCRGTYGGGISNSQSSPRFEDCTFIANTAEYGGGMYNYQSSPTLENCRFTGNTADSGSGAYNYESSPALVDCLFTGNSAAYYGGGVLNYASSPVLVSCVFRENSADVWGGGVLNVYDSNPAIVDCTVTNNSAAEGGGLYSINNCDDNSTPSVTDTVLCGNAPDHTYGPWVDNGGNCLSFACVDANDDGTPESCGGAASDVLTVPSKTYPTIASAIEAASSGDVILVGPGIYTADHPAHVVDMLGKAVTLRSSDGPEATIIDGEGVRRGLACFNGETSNTKIDGFTIRNGFGTEYDYDGDGTIASWEGNGGGMYNSGSSPSLENCTFTGNRADGGGMYNHDSSPRVIDCSFVENAADVLGGGMYNSEGSSPFLGGCTFTRNSAELGGGGMYNFGAGTNPTLTSCVFENNSALSAGGESPYSQSTLSYGAGGGMQNRNGPCAKLESCVFIGNTAQGGGGIYNLYYSNTSLSNCTFTGNSAVDYAGGALFSLLASTTTLTNTIVCDNTNDQIYGDWLNSGGNVIATSCSCPADINGDGVVDGGDLTYLLSAWGTGDPVVDVNNDGIIDGNDLTIILASWGPCS